MPRPAGYALASGIGDLIYLLWKTGRRNTTDNMARVLGTAGSRAQARALARQSMRNYCKTLADFICLPRFSAADIQRLVHFDGWPGFDRALAHGKGMIFVTMHMGSWDMGGAALGTRGYRFSVLADAVGTSALNRKVVRTRQEKGFNIVPAGRVPKAALSALRKNQILGVVMDRPVSDGVTVQFFGAPATFPPGVAALSLRTGAPVLAGCILRHAGDTYRGMAHDPIFPCPSGDRQADIMDLTQQIVDSMEDFIRLDPAQWFAFRRIWAPEAAIQPAGASNRAVPGQC